MFAIRNALLGLAMTASVIVPDVALAAMPFSPATAQPLAGQNGDTAPVTDIRYVCDAYGCYDRPDFPPPRAYRPPPPPDYYRPAPPPPGYYRPAPPPPGRGWRRHVEWCLDRYRSYNPDTNRYIDAYGRPRICRSPFD
ncbi:BA14K family protein [Allorhizobium undicola]|uniref:BA14K family protein n=1 Tax=Allorhizobium undicola TaxID=78527 RepID=UPI000569A073|nr:BA14K family protein [Allorhizobium undicola]